MPQRTVTGSKSPLIMYGQIIPVIKKYDEALNKADPKQNKLLLQASSKGLTFCIFNVDLNKFLSIESVEIIEAKRLTDASGLLRDYIKNNDKLNQPFLSIKIFLESNKSTLIPAPLFDPTEKENFSNFNFTLEEQETVFFDHLKHSDAFVLYAYPIPFIKVLNESFPDQLHYSYAGAFIESMLIINKNQKSRTRLYVNVRKTHLDILILDGNKLLYFNTFNYRSKEDFIYFIIFVLEQLRLNPEEVELMLMGMIDRNTGLYGTIYKYVRNVTFQPMVEKFNYSYIFNEIPYHHYINLLNYELCEL
jgi:hypothetical protein